MTDLACAIDLLEDRASLYRLLASLYYQPLSEEQIDALAASDLAGLAGDSESPFAPAYRDLHGALPRASTCLRTTCRSSSPTWAVFATMPPRPCARETKARPPSFSSANDPSSGPMWPRGYGIFWPRRG